MAKAWHADTVQAQAKPTAALNSPTACDAPVTAFCERNRTMRSGPSTRWVSSPAGKKRSMPPEPGRGNLGTPAARFWSGRHVAVRTDRVADFRVHAATVAPEELIHRHAAQSARGPNCQVTCARQAPPEAHSWRALHR